MLLQRDFFTISLFLKAGGGELAGVPGINLLPAPLRPGFLGDGELREPWTGEPGWGPGALPTPALWFPFQLAGGDEATYPPRLLQG